MQFFYPIVDIPKDVYGILGVVFTTYGIYLFLRAYVKKSRI
jgi:hypothetical protein